MIHAQGLHEIPGYEEWSEIRKLEKGWSHDEKYYIKASDGKELLLRISSAEYLERKRHEFDVLTRLSGSVPYISHPVSLGTCLDHTKAYLLLTWVPGDDAETRVGALSIPEQYNLGLESGKILKAIHSIPAPESQESWSERFNRKIDRNIKNYLGCGVTFPYADQVIGYIQEHRHLLEGRAQSLQHGDYHTGNLILTPDRHIGVIDFNRCDYGDPWEEFNRITFSVEVSPSFAAGQIDGYFNDNPPDVFFRLMALYIWSNAIASLPWAIPYGEKEVAVMLNLINQALETYDYFRTIRPKWYTLLEKEKAK
ncbi:MAG: phosphotransferase [Clostridia bacterium]|nr:phosphotransferase [Clostridia bacterium]